MGSETTRQLVHLGHEVTVIDSLTYASHVRNLESVSAEIKFFNIDIRDGNKLNEALTQNLYDAVINFAAETHVDNSIKSPRIFLETNVIGTFNLLEAAQKYNFRLLQVSTDEVYGSTSEGSFTEKSRFNPSSPYSASKAAAEMFVNAFVSTYGLDIVGVRCSNNYGPFQNTEKLIPTLIQKTINNEKLPLYGNGNNVREWIHVSDSSRAIITVLLRGTPGSFYNISSGIFKENLEVARKVLDYFGAQHSQIEFVEDRPGHDFRYAIDSSKIREELGWYPKVDFDSGLRETIDWYSSNVDWALKNREIFQ